jgi:endonuclease/exonuclease/phosphatase family metal-dependent hydrolase
MARIVTAAARGLQAARAYNAGRSFQLMRSRFSIRGVLLVLALFAIGGAMLWGLFLAPRMITPAAPLDSTWGVPERPLRFVSYNILHCQRGSERVVEEIKQHQPDFVLLQEVESRDVIELASRMEMKHHHHPRLYHPSVNLDGPKATWGNFILSKHPIYEAGSIPNPGGGSFGVWATAVVDGKKFVVANVHLSATWNANPIHIKQSGNNRHKELTALANAWRARGSPPIVIGGDFNQIPTGNNWALMTGTWRDALGAIGKDDNTFGEGLLRTRIDYFVTTPDWRPTSGGVARPGASDHRLIWVELRGANAAASTRPTTARQHED